MPMKKQRHPCRGYLSNIVAFIIATTVGMMVFFHRNSHHAADQWPRKTYLEYFQAEHPF